MIKSFKLPRDEFYYSIIDQFSFARISSDGRGESLGVVADYRGLHPVK